MFFQASWSLASLRNEMNLIKRVALVEIMARLWMNDYLGLRYVLGSVIRSTTTFPRHWRFGDHM